MREAYLTLTQHKLKGHIMVTVTFLNELVFVGVGIAIAKIPSITQSKYQAWQDRRELKKLKKQLGQ